MDRGAFWWACCIEGDVNGAGSRGLCVTDSGWGGLLSGKTVRLNLDYMLQQLGGMCCSFVAHWSPIHERQPATCQQSNNPFMSQRGSMSETEMPHFLASRKTSRQGKPTKMTPRSSLAKERASDICFQCKGLLHPRAVSWCELVLNS